MFDSKILKDLARSWEKKATDKSIVNIWADTIRHSKNTAKIKIAYLSTDFCNHPVGRFMLPILELHNKELFEIYGLNCGYNNDDIGVKIRQSCNKWIELENLTDIEAARKISEEQIDIIVELGGYTSGSRLGILVHKPARIQLSYLGYYAPTYLTCIDGWIGDEVLFSRLNKVQREAHNLYYIDKGYMRLQYGDLPKPKRKKR